MSLHVFVRFEPKPGKQRELLAELTLLLEPTRAEPGCIRIYLYQSTRDPAAFFFHSEWTDEAAFDAHVQLPHLKRFLALAPELITHPVQAVRTTQVA